MMGNDNQKYDYDVFTRIKRGDNLIHIGSVSAENDELAKVYANFVYDEEDWVEMCIIRRNQIAWVKQPEGLFGKTGVITNG
jgi:1,2-phenylacetyl-CoA epoxidase PaaB subunit